MWTIALPLRVPLPSKKKERWFTLNLNVYRNTHPMVLNQAKVSFDEIAGALIRGAGIPRLERCTLEFVLYPGTKRQCDVSNVCSIQDKFFSDSLVNHGVLTDDNYNYLAESRYRFGAVDRENPRVDVVVRSPDHIPTVHPEPLQESHEPMKITNKTTLVAMMSAEDVETAVRKYLMENITDPISLEAKITMKEHKGGGYEVTIEQEVELTGEPKDKAKTGAKKHKERLDPKEAMAQLPNFGKVVPVPEAEKPALPLVGEEKGHVEAVPTVIAVAGTPVEISTEVEAKTEAPPPPKPASSLFANFKRPSNP